MPKKRRVPAVLWRLFRDRARTLNSTILSLIPHATSFLLQPDDPALYRKLLDHTFVFLNDTAPPFPHFRPDNRWTQHQIVTRTIEMIMGKQPASCNVICSSYDKCHRSSPVVDLLTSSEWTCLLKRVGDDLMIYLLEHTSLFLSLPWKKHHQVAGPPISSLIFKLPNYVAESKRQHPSGICSGSNEKSDGVHKSNSISGRQYGSFCSDGALSSFSFIEWHHVGDIRPSSKYYTGKCGQSCSELAGSMNGVIAKNYVEHSGGQLQCLDQNMGKPKKRSRPFKWQRSKKRLCMGLKEGNHIRKSQHQCGCCLILHAMRSITKGLLIDRQPMFYNLEHSSSVLPEKHVINCLKPNSSGSRSLMCDIFGLPTIDALVPSVPCSHTRDFGDIKSTCLYHLLDKLFRGLMRRMRSCNQRMLLDKHCSVSSLDKNSMATCSSGFEENRMVELEKSTGVSTSNSQFTEIKSYCSKSQVVSFIWAVCRHIVPPDLLGAPSNWRILRRTIFRFIRLRRYEKFSLNQCMYKLKSSGFPFLLDKHSLCYLESWLKNEPRQSAATHDCLSNLYNAANNLKHIVLQKWIFWLFSSLVVPLVQANFYVTESENGKQDIYYYRKSTWEKVRSNAISDMTDHNFQPLRVMHVHNIISKRSFGFSKLRFRPKENGIRMLANLQAPSRMPVQDFSSLSHPVGKWKKAKLGFGSGGTGRFKYFRSVNSVLRDTHAVLKGIQQKEPQKLGSSVFDYNDVYRQLCPFITALKKGSAAIPSVFIVVCDVSKAFDSIDQEKLLSVMKDVINKDDYLLEQSFKVVCSKRSVWGHENLMLSDREACTDFAKFGSSHLFGSLHSVLVNQGLTRHLRKEELLSNLYQHVKCNVLLLDKKFYLQGTGIAQGSILSSLLCSLYYAHLERNVIFPSLERTTEVNLSRGDDNQDVSIAADNKGDRSVSFSSYKLLRFIDDFLFISTSKRQAASFFTGLHRGFREYNCYMNESKFCFNFNIGWQSGLPSNRLYVGDDGISFLRWSGLLLNSCTLEVQADYTRYLNNHLSSSLTVCWHSKPALHLKTKLCGFLRPKCHPLFYDSNINSAPVIRLNIFQAFLLCAMKFHCYVSEMSYICQLHAISYWKIIKKSMRYIYVLLKRRMHFVSRGSNHLLQLEEEEVEWLGLNAYNQVLKRKQSRHKDLLSLLKSKLSSHRISTDVSANLKYAIDRSHSSLLWNIKY